MIIGVGLIRGQVRRPRTLIAPSVFAAPLTLTRSQAAGAQSTADADVRYTVVMPGSLTAPLTLARSQAAGAVATGEV